MAAKSRRKIKGKGLSQYIAARITTILFAVCLGVGLFCGSMFAVGQGETTQMLHTMTAHEIELVNERNYMELIMRTASGFAGYLVAIYLCVNSRKGDILIYAVPVAHGLAVGSMVTVLLTKGMELLPYVMMCIVLPKILETYLLLALCNKTIGYCKENFNKERAYGKKATTGVPVGVYLMLSLAYFFIEGLFILFFRNLYCF